LNLMLIKWDLVVFNVKVVMVSVMLAPLLNKAKKPSLIIVHWAILRTVRRNYNDTIYSINRN